jgi:hypothetical protein
MCEPVFSHETESRRARAHGCRQHKGKPRPLSTPNVAMPFDTSTVRISAGFGLVQFVAQVSNLPYRGFPIRALPATRACRLEVGDTADWKSALQKLRCAPFATSLRLSEAFR